MAHDTKPTNTTTQTGKDAQATVANDAPVFDKAPAMALGARMYTADTSFRNAVDEIAADVARLMGTEPSYTQWNLVHAAWNEGYQEKGGVHPKGHPAAGQFKVGDKAVEARWTEIVKKLEGFQLKKPQAPTPEAAKKSEQRAKAEEEAKALIEATGAKTPQAIVKLTHAKKGAEPLSKMTVNALQAEAKKIADAALKDQRETLKKERAEILERIVARCRNTLDLSQLRKVDDLTERLEAETLSAQPTPPKGDTSSDSGTAPAGAGSDGAGQATGTNG